ncbi:hypothetical protein [Defluviimonas sp. SAOS-178_SWC]|uniref:hypothetical protein n=1 Tax=Defluviimonas sp. SAOS-178_SWC TaxID=3121287 RepID=UPI00322167B1
MARWTRKRIKGSDPRGEDWSVFREGEAVGRVYYEKGRNGAPDWFWASWVIPAASGRSETREEALEQVRRAVTPKDPA